MRRDILEAWNRLGMKTVSLNKERKIILAVGLLLLVAGGLYRFIPLFESVTVDTQAISLKERKLAGYKAMIRSRNDLEARKTFLIRTVERAETFLLSGGSSSLGAVDLQNRITEICERGGIQVKTMRVLKPEPFPEGFYMKIPLEVTLEATIRQVEELLYRIESLEKYLTLTMIRITSTEDETKLNATFIVEGYMGSQNG
jgi:Tfp pilus assembly protein PilO